MVEHLSPKPGVGSSSLSSRANIFEMKKICLLYTSLESFKWLGIPFDEGVSFGGEHGPYRQSERRDIYKKYVQVLLEMCIRDSLCFAPCLPGGG